MAAVPLAHTIQAMLYVGGDFLELGDPTGIHSLRVLVQKRKAADVIQTNTDEAMSSKEPRHVPSISNDMLRASLARSCGFMPYCHGPSSVIAAGRAQDHLVKLVPGRPWSWRDEKLAQTVVTRPVMSQE